MMKTADGTAERACYYVRDSLMSKEFHQTAWNDELRADWLKILDLALREDLATPGDCTTLALVPREAQATRAAIVARKPGVLAGETLIAATPAKFSPDLQWSARGQRRLAHLAGPEDWPTCRPGASDSCG